mmetsp:Transcript_89449/g.158768  ORF Transcript_89449/g.158768 Transcript_89449/m.158768 type:complete len:293 (-) Transcript_89449:28-906(-)
MPLPTAAVTVGGRWREIELENESLVLQLGRSREEVDVAQAALRCAQDGLASADHLESALRSELAEALQDRDLAQEKWTSSQRACEELAEAAQLSHSWATELGESRDAFSAESYELKRELQVAEAEASRFRALAASSEQRTGLERSSRWKAEARNEHFEAELAVVQGRLANRGTHVDLLLREKERLFVQLARRRQGEAERPMRPKSAPMVKRGSSQGGDVPGSTPSMSTAAGKSDKGRAVCETGGTLAELERKLWHAQRALERERACHEATRNALAKRLAEAEHSSAVANAGA